MVTVLHNEIQLCWNKIIDKKVSVDRKENEALWFMTELYSQGNFRLRKFGHFPCADSVLVDVSS